MIARWSWRFRRRHRDVEVLVFVPRWAWPAWCVGLALDYQRSGRERQVKATLGLAQVVVEVIDR